jgi:8-oxo-dGTP diphosphatase
MQYETSAGGVIVGEKNGKSVVLLLKDKSGNWTFPKGLVEKGENPESAAHREISEEVGIKHLQLVAPLTPIHYYYKWEGKLKKKTVYYFLFQGKGSEIPTPQTDEGILEVRWFSLEQAEQVVGYRKTNSPVLKEAAQKFLISNS